jgi:hypothetical protein
VIGDVMEIAKKSELFDMKTLKNYKKSFPKNSESFLKSVTGGAASIGMLEIIAFNMVTNFSFPLTHFLFEEFEKSEYFNLCLEKFELFLLQKKRK